MEIHRSARKHGIDDADIVQVAGGFLVAYRIDDDAELAVHAMKARPEYVDQLS